MLTTSATSVLGTYPITIQGTSGAISQTVTVSLTITTAATVTGPPPGAALTSSTATLTWDSPPGATQYRVKLGSTPGGTDYQAETYTTSQSMTIGVPSASQTTMMYATLGTSIGGSWATNTYAYWIGVTRPLSGPIVLTNAPLPGPEPYQPPEGGWVLNDNQPKEYDFCVAQCQALYCACDGAAGQAYRVSACRIANDNNVSGQITSWSALDTFTVQFRATRNAPPGQRHISCTIDSQESVVNGTLGVYDATPVITGVSQEASTGGSFGITITGNYFGRSGTVSLCDQGNQAECSAPGIAVNVTQWTDSEIRATVNPSDGTAGDYDVQLNVGSGLAGSAFLARFIGSGSKPQTRHGTVHVQASASASLIQFEWEGNRLWRTSTVISNGDANTGDESIGPLVWQDPNGDGHVLKDYPANLKIGEQNSLTNAVVRLDKPLNQTATLRITVTPAPAEFTFPDVPITFNNGQATVDFIPTSTIPDSVSAIKKGQYTFSWQIRFANAMTFHEFRRTTHTIYFTHTQYQNGEEYNRTTARLDYLMQVLAGEQLSDLSSLVYAFAKNANEVHEFDATCHIAQQLNLWTGLVGGEQGIRSNSAPCAGLDCISLSGVVAVMLHQVGYTSAEALKAYPTGAIPAGDTDATSPENLRENGTDYRLGFGNPVNEFEGYVSFNNNAYMVAPYTERAIGPTGCTVSPSTTGNRVAFHVLTTLKIGGQYWVEWAGDHFTGRAKEPQTMIPLPRTNCPPDEQ